VAFPGAVDNATLMDKVSKPEEFRFELNDTDDPAQTVLGVAVGVKLAPAMIPML
jgi:hypothetical protein